jgi:putative transposase
MFGMSISQIRWRNAYERKNASHRRNSSDFSTSRWWRNGAIGLSRVSHLRSCLVKDSLPQPFGCNSRRSDGIAFSERLFYREGMNYRFGSHTKFKIEYDHSLLEGEGAQWVSALTRQTCECLELHIFRGVVSKDHVNLLVSASTKLSPAEVMRRIKGRTSSKLLGVSSSEALLGPPLLGRGLFCIMAGELNVRDDSNLFGAPFRTSPGGCF